MLLYIVCHQSNDGGLRCEVDYGLNISGRAQKYYSKGYIEQPFGDFEHLICNIDLHLPGPFMCVPVDVISCLANGLAMSLHDCIQQVAIVRKSVVTDNRVSVITSS